MELALTIGRFTLSSLWHIGGNRLPKSNWQLGSGFFDFPENYNCLTSPYYSHLSYFFIPFPGNQTWNLILLSW